MFSVSIIYNKKLRKKWYGLRKRYVKSVFTKMKRRLSFVGWEFELTSSCHIRWCSIQSTPHDYLFFFCLFQSKTVRVLSKGEVWEFEKSLPTGYQGENSAGCHIAKSQGNLLFLGANPVVFIPWSFAFGASLTSEVEETPGSTWWSSIISSLTGYNVRITFSSSNGPSKKFWKRNCQWLFSFNAVP